MKGHIKRGPVELETSAVEMLGEMLRTGVIIPTTKYLGYSLYKALLHKLKVIYIYTQTMATFDIYVEYKHYKTLLGDMNGHWILCFKYIGVIEFGGHERPGKH